MQVTRLIRDLNAAAGAALVFLVWDILITLDDEVEYIWTKPWNSWIKWAFLFARYFSLLTQICNRGIEWAVISEAPLHSPSIRVWFGMQAFLTFMIMTGAEIVMMARVYALYNKNKWVAYGFITLLLVELTATICGIAVTFPKADTFISDDLVKHTPRSMAYFGIATIISQVIILALCVTRYIRGRWDGARIVQLMLRDGTIAFCALVVVTSCLIVWVVLDEPYAATNYAFLISFIASCECRLILNMLSLPTLETGWTTSNSGPELTTVLATHDRYWEATQERQMTIFSQT